MKGNIRFGEYLVEKSALNNCLQWISNDYSRDIEERRSSVPEHHGSRPYTICKEWLTFVDTRIGKIFKRRIRYLTTNAGKNSLPQNQVIKYAGYWISVACIKEKNI